MTTSNAKQSLLNEFETTLNEHGYGFQYAVLQKVKELHDSEQSSFCVEGAEFPVAVGPDDKHNTKIDFVALRTTRLPPGSDGGRGPKMFLLAECKRSNPDYTDWCFIKAPFTRRTGLANSLVIETGLIRGHLPQPIMRTIQSLAQTTNFYHLGIPIKTDRKTGKRTGPKENDRTAPKANDAIEKAA